MDTLLKTYSKVFAELTALNDKLISLQHKLDTNKSEYLQNVSNAKNKLNDDLAENNNRITKVNAFIGIAKTHSIRHNDALSAKPFDSGVLSRLSVQINSGLSDDPFAVQLYTEATAQLIYLKSEVATLTQKTESYIDTLTQKHTQVLKSIENEIAIVRTEIVSYLHADSFVEFISLLLRDKSTFGGSADASTLSPEMIGTVSLGTIEFPFPIPKGLEQEMVEKSKGLCNTFNSTICVPANVDITGGKVVVAEYENETEALILKGIQNLVLNIARHYGQDFAQVVFVDPIRFNSSSLGCLARISGSTNSFIDAVPTSMEEVRKKLKNIISEINIREVRSEHLSVQSKKKALYVFHDFPQAYDANLVSQIQQLCVNAEHYGIVVAITHNNSSKNYTSSDAYKFIQTLADNILNTNGVFKFENFQNQSAKYTWYVAPEQLPRDIERVYIDEKPVVDLSNDYAKRIGLASESNNRKGYRKIENIPYGINAQGELQYLDFENSNFATFICGAARSGKSTLLHTLITGMIKNNHPDDIEIWLIDFKMTEFSRYINHTPPHIRYIILDESPELVYDIIDRLTEILIKRQNMFKGKWLKLGEVPTEKYMPAIMVIIDEFSVMSQIIADSIASSNENYSVKLQMLLAKGAALGLHFIFASQGFTSGTRGLNDFSKKQIQQRVSMKTEYNEIKETLDLKSATDEDKAMMEQLTVHHTLTRIPADERGNHLKLSQVLYISDYTEQEKMIDSISESMYTVPRYDPVNTEVYISKKPMIIDGNLYLAFNSKKDEMLAYYDSHRDLIELDGERVLFVGEPRRMLPLFPINVANEFCENILMVAPASEKMAASSVVLSVARSLEMQNSTISLWSTKKNPVFRQIKFECNEDFTSQSELDSICAEIKNLKGRIQSNVEVNEFYVLLGFETIFTDMSFQVQNELSAMSSTSQVAYEKREAGEPDLLTQLAASLSGGKPSNAPSTTVVQKASTVARAESTKYDAREDLKYILTNGPRLGYHFMLVFSTVGDLRQTKIDTSLFKHKIMFRTAKPDAMTVVGTSNAGVISELEDHSFRYTNGLDSLSFRPYLHPGLSWDGWQLSANGVINAVDDEEEYLL